VRPIIVGLAAALPRYLREWSEYNDIDSKFQGAGPAPGVLSPAAETAFYRIVQECVNNILKHSQAAQASIRIRRTKERLTLTVRDDGRGFAQDSAPAGSLGGFGLTGISERAQLLGGRAAIHSALGQGTTVTIEINSEG